MTNERKRIAVVTKSVDADTYVFEEHQDRLHELGIDVKFEVFEIKDVGKEGYGGFLGYDGLLVHPGMDYQKGALTALKDLKGIRWALYCLDINDSVVASDKGQRIFDINDGEGIRNYFFGGGNDK